MTYISFLIFFLFEKYDLILLLARSRIYCLKSVNDFSDNSRICAPHVLYASFVEATRSSSFRRVCVCVCAAIKWQIFSLSFSFCVCGGRDRHRNTLFDAISPCYTHTALSTTIATIANI